MRLFILSFVLLLTQLAPPSALAKPFMHTTQLWAAGESGFDTYRIPGIVVTHRGTVVAYAVARLKATDGDWADMQIVMRRSTDGGKHWEKSRVVAGDVHGVTDNPVAIASRENGVVHFLYQHDYARVFYMKSTDDAAHFSDPVEITAALTDLRSQFDWNVVAMGPGHAIELKSGRLLVPVWLAAGKVSANGRRQHGPSAITTIYSDDAGATWHHGDLIATNTEAVPNPNEFQVVQLNDGRIMANIRSGGTQLQRAVAISPDGIGHWSTPAFDPHLYDPVCAAGIVRLENGDLLFTNPDSSALPKKPNGQGLRHDITVRLSEDNGQSWPVAKLLAAGPTGYSDIAASPKGSDELYDIYEEKGDANSPGLSIDVARFNLEWLKAK